MTAWGLGLFVTYLVRHPVISVCLDNNKGCTGITPLVELQEQTDEEGRRVQVARFLHDVRYFRLRVENPGLASIKDCCGLITRLKKRTAHGETVPPQEVFHLGWAHHTQSRMRDIPRGAYFYMDIATLDLLRPTRRLGLPADFPTSLFKFFDAEKATYEFTILIAADNAKPQRDIKVTFKYDPTSDDLEFIPVEATRLPWWYRLWPFGPGGSR